LERKVTYGAILVITLLVTIFCIGMINAYFSRTLLSGPNIFAAGTIGLQTGPDSTVIEHFYVAGLVPGDSGNAAYWQLMSVGTISSDLSIRIGDIVNGENIANLAEMTVGDPENDIIGELGGYLRVAFWLDHDNSGTWTAGDCYLRADGATVWFSVDDIGLPAEAYQVINSYDGVIWAGLSTGIAGGSIIGHFVVDYDLPDQGHIDNIYQSDSCTFPIMFTLTQSN